ncbi:site-specific DNA-methyltransferase [Paraburkholderia sp. RP-4-7]|uniref:site-specific DNA-methyltransferase (cytosine-N(4)-specific) n=1 Tax=Paraburkholderia polaris TaxID=2728848 RepID=A0A848IH39_9BURK|nr:DNA methyltransferase [Paraburkholderia polaris]NML98776.1 site-specific DNA-methyltransferase [Paraburkholderia polaris]
MLDSLVIGSPKRKKNSQSGWTDFFPYYAGFPEDFAKNILQSSGLPSSAVIFDPWNGSGTTTYAAAQLGYASCGIDLNPVMVLVARARSLARTEADSIAPQAKSLTKDVSRLAIKIRENDPLLQWFDVETGNVIRAIESRIRSRLVGTDAADLRAQFDKISCFAATFYVALFTICRRLTAPYRSSNPTWLKTPKGDEAKLTISAKDICSAFVAQATCMADALQKSSFLIDPARVKIAVGNTTEFKVSGLADLILTSPPYCTRIDYTAATRVELALISTLLTENRDDLSRQMIGSIKVPDKIIEPSIFWGETCLKFLDRLRSHDSKASKGYYYKTHLDYFEKMSRSIYNMRASMKRNAIAIMVVQDSYYKDLHNDVPTILGEMAENIGFKMRRREDFIQGNSFLGINSRSRIYRDTSRAVESVICFEK